MPKRHSPGSSAATLWSLAVVLAAAQACGARGGGERSRSRDQAPAESSHAGRAQDGSVAPDVPPAWKAATTVSGSDVVANACGACHTELPPSRLAPPFRMVASNYQLTARDSAEFVSRIVAWVRAPAAERSWLSGHIIRKFGLMPAPDVPNAAAREAASYIWSLGAYASGRKGENGRQP